MQHQYWVTKKSVLRKLGGKEDECVVSSDAELDAKLELFKSITESCNHLQRVIDLYQERLCYLAQEENSLGRYLKECGKNEKNASAGQIVSTAGKAVAYAGHQRLAVRSPLIRLHHEVETFRGRAITDTRGTIAEMEKVRTEYRAALSWMKSASSQLDPDSGHGLERFRKAQSYVKATKTKFDRLTLACLQKVDLLAAARCNMFSHALVPYQNSLVNFSAKASEILTVAALKLDCPIDNVRVLGVAISLIDTDKDRKTFFNAEYTDEGDQIKKEEGAEDQSEKDDSPQSVDVSDLLEGDFPLPDLPPHSPEGGPSTNNESKPSSALLDLTWTNAESSDFLRGDFMPSKLLQEGSFNFTGAPIQEQAEEGSSSSTEKVEKPKGTADKVSWLSLFAELDPLANLVTDDNNAEDRA